MFLDHIYIILKAEPLLPFYRSTDSITSQDADIGFFFSVQSVYHYLEFPIVQQGVVFISDDTQYPTAHPPVANKSKLGSYLLLEIWH